SMNTSTVALGSAVPAIVGVALVVAPAAGAVITGAGGGQSMPPTGALASTLRGRTPSVTSVPSSESISIDRKSNDALEPVVGGWLSVISTCVVPTVRGSMTPGVRVVGTPPTVTVTAAGL